MDRRILVDLVAALVPFVVGAIWYNPFVLGKVWTEAAGVPQTPLPAWRTALIFILSYIGCYYIAASLGPIVIHQWEVHGMLAHHNQELNTPGTDLYILYHNLMDKYGSEYRTFKHGAWHGYQTGIKFAFPIILIIGLFEKKKVAWIAINALYWIICLTLMGGIICAYMPIP
jgi:hypothetical protein